jgi:hypothetical protein
MRKKNEKIAASKKVRTSPQFDYAPVKVVIPSGSHKR